MAGFTAMVQSSNDMIRIRRTLVVSLVTGKAARIHQLIVVVCMTVLASGRTVFPGQRELRGIVIKRGGLPCGCRVTLTASLRIAQRLVIRIGCTGILGTMTIEAIHRQTGELIVGMTILAQHGLVCAGQRKSRIVVRE
jgi:hypothetical protein